jgi:hypothetical protein
MGAIFLSQLQNARRCSKTGKKPEIQVEKCGKRERGGREERTYYY